MRVILALAVIIVAGLVIGLSCDKATEPGPNGGQKQYSVFFRDWDDTLYIQYTPETGKIDSIYLPFKAGGMTSSHDGRLLYLRHADSTIVYEVATGELSVFEPGGGRPIVVSPDGKYMALEGENFRIIRLSDLAVVHQDTAEVSGGRFAPNGPTYYGGSKTDSMLYKVSLEPVPSVELFDVEGGPRFAVPLADEQLVFLRWWAPAVEVFDLEADSFVFQQYYGYYMCESGYVEVTPGSRYVFLSNPNEGGIGTECSPFEPIRVYDVAANDIVHELSIETYYFDSDGDSIPSPFDAAEMIVTPDGRWLVVLGPPPGLFVTINLIDMQVARHEYVGPWRTFRYLTGPQVP